MRYLAHNSPGLTAMIAIVCVIGASFAIEAADGGPENTIEKARQVARLFNGEFFLHGVLVDQFHHPIDGAELELEVGGISGSLGGVRGRYYHQKTTSDANGKFSFTGVKGYVFNIKSIRKTGYQFILREFYWNYQSLGTPVAGDISAPDRPRVILGWKSAPPEELAEIKISNDVPPGTQLPRLVVNSVDELSHCARFRVVLSGDPKIDPEKTWRAYIEAVSTTDDAADWDLELSLDPTAQMSEPPEARSKIECPLFPAWFPVGTAIRVRAKHGGVQQADWRFPYLAPEAGYHESVALDWENSELSLSPNDRILSFYYLEAHTSHFAYVRIKYESGFVVEKNQSPKERKICAVVKLTDNFGQPAGVVNPHGSRILEYSDAFNRQQIEQRMKPIRDKEQAERDARREAKLDWFRKNDPAEARLIEERMRSQGKVVPPPKE